MPSTIEKSRVLLKTANSGIIKRLVNIHSIYKDGNFFEYKITLEGFPRGDWNFLTNTQLHSVDGLLRVGNRRRLRGSHIEIGYHNDGKTAYKDVGGEWNIKPMVPNAPIRKILKPIIFFRISGFYIRDLISFNETPTGERDLLNDLPYDLDTRLTCDFHLSGWPKSGQFRYRITLADNVPYRNSHFVVFEDEDEKIDIHLHFYETSALGGPYFMIVRNDLWGQIKQKGYYYIYLLKKYLKRST